MYPLETKRDVGKLKWQHNVRNMIKKRLPAIADRTVWEKVRESNERTSWNKMG